MKLEQQASQSQDVNDWTTHQELGKERPRRREYPRGFKGQMYPVGTAAAHPAAADLKKWATEGCPVDTGPQWTREQINAALERGPHLSDLKPEAMEAFQEEVASKLEQKQVRILQWDDIKQGPPKEMKLSPMAQIPHKSRAYRTLLDLSYAVMREGKVLAQSVNSTTVPLAPEKALMQMGSFMPR